MCRFLSWHKLSTHLGKYQGMWFLDLMVGICLFFRKKLPNSLLRGLYHFAFLPAWLYFLCCSTFLPAFDVAVFWILVILIYTSWKQSHFLKKIFQFPNDVWCIFSYRWENMKCINLHHLCRGHADLCMILILAYVLPRWALPFLLIPKLKDVTAKTNM